MRSLKITHDYTSFAVVLKACLGIEDYGLGLQVHCLAIHMGFVKDVVTGSALVDMYSKFKKLDDAFKVFREMPTDFGYDCIVETATLDMYAKCGRMSDAWKVFNMLPNRQSYNAIIVGYARKEQGFKALEIFQFLQRTYLGFDDISLSGALTASCAGQQALNNGMEIHGRIIKSGMGLDCFVGSALVDMYSKCGMLTEAEKIHDRLEEQTTVSWNSIISGFSSQKQSENAQIYVSQMLEKGVIPDNFTYATETFQMMLTVAYGGLLKSIKSLVGLSGNLTTSNIYSSFIHSSELVIHATIE
ncbi:Pentatricopeptide repeat-containing protein [Vigna angularis]|uniref:Pentatricopeptide repeat-containing protein n=1 Tax=Phaseolus angularis TaxID=3914 RepID=A0A8T0L1R2_PHAAN|nr:Pentatricopeptide repeat-containing protein [Vigna angularis]